MVMKIKKTIFFYPVTIVDYLFIEYRSLPKIFNFGENLRTFGRSVTPPPQIKSCLS